MELRGRRVLIRAFTPSDAEDFLAYARLSAVAQAAGMRPVTTAAEAAATVTRFARTGSDYAIDYQGHVIGNIGVYPRLAGTGQVDPQAREVGYALAPKYWGQGLMKEALMLVCAALFTQGLRAIWAGVFPDNARSIGLLEHLGFTYQFTVPLPVGLRAGGPTEEAYYRLRPPT